MPNPFHKNIRMQDWDYSHAAVYMVTICVADREHRFGRMNESDEMLLNDAGRMVRQEILALGERHA